MSDAGCSGRNLGALEMRDKHSLSIIRICVDRMIWKASRLIHRLQVDMKSRQHGVLSRLAD